jgi:hypothetical protein
MVPLEQFDDDIEFMLYSSSLKKSMTTTTIGGCGAICEGGGAIWRRRRDLEKATRLEGGSAIWRRRHDLEAVVRFGGGGHATGDRRELRDARFFL